MSWALLPWGSPHYPLYRKLNGPPSMSQHDREETNILPLPEVDAHYLAVQPIAW